MILAELRLRNFRAHKNTGIKFSNNLNYITGGNGQGKTSLLEAIYYLSTTKSNSSKDSEVVSFFENDFEINGTFKDSVDNEVRVYYSNLTNKKIYFKNQKQVFRSADIIGEFPVVLLTPSDHSITQGSPSDRRKFVDSVISQASNTYLKILLDYNKTLKQRTALFNKYRETKNRNILNELDAWTEKLIITGTDLIKSRKKFCNNFSEFILDSYREIMERNEVPEIKYHALSSEFDLSDNEIEGEFRNLIERLKDEEIRRGTNLAGPHRDDFVFKLNDLNLKTYGSQGQHKTFQVVLRFAEFFYLKEVTNKVPLFLLDDVFGELDKYRSLKISQSLSKIGQAFITLTDFTDLSYLQRRDDDMVMKVEKGTVEYV